MVTRPTPPAEIVRALYATELFVFAQRAFTELRPGVVFRYGDHLRAICRQLERVFHGEVSRLMILMPPRHLKSHCASVAFPAWALGRDPSLRIVCASYGADLGEGFGRETLRLLGANWVRAVFPRLVLDRRKCSAAELRTTRNGARVATSVGGPLTGKGGDILIIDDPMKAEDAASQTRRDALWDWFTGTATTRLDDPKAGAIVVIAQRLHEDDLPGRLIAAGGWTVLELPAIETRTRRIDLGDGVVWTRRPGDILLPAHMGRPELERHRRELGQSKFEAQFQQAPTPAGGAIIRPEWFQTIPHPLARRRYEAVLQSWDTAAVPGESNDWSVCTTWGLLGNHIDLLDVHRAQHLYPELLAAAVKLGAEYDPNLIVVETAGVGRALVEQLRRRRPRGVRPCTPRGGKVERMSAQTAMLEAGEVRIPEAAPWRESFLAEAAAFPNGRHDDQVDSLSQALFAIARRPAELRRCSRYKG